MKYRWYSALVWYWVGAGKCFLGDYFFERLLGYTVFLRYPISKEAKWVQKYFTDTRILSADFRGLYVRASVFSIFVPVSESEL